ncbi:MAG TPA: dihydrolipoyl dehydrogenase [Pseudogracilibacillus sp.]|nr:dihydrolipoyl dehydrogenase [Pseudogracilibacillus sp.]
MSKEYDLVVLGGGTGGYVAALRASQLGMNVAIVEKNKLGGTCLHEGCIPSKALLKTAELYRQTKNVATYGIEVNEPTLRLDRAQQRKDEVIETLHNGVISLIKRAGIDLYNGMGRLLGPSIFSPLSGSVSIEYNDGSENTILVPKFVLIATGSIPNNLQGFTVDGERILHTTEALQLQQLPESFIIIGGGVIGIEWASMLVDLGVQVTVIEKAPTILEHEDHDVQTAVKRALTKRGVRFVTNCTIDTESVQVDESGVTFSIQIESEKENVHAEKVLLAVGRKANIDDIGLRNTSVKLENNFIKTNEVYQTDESHIYAIGDCIGGMQLAHVASAEGIIAVEHIASENPTPLDVTRIPSCIYSYPEVGKVGLTEEEAIAHGYDVKVGKTPFASIGKAHVNGDVDGFMKVITDKTTEDILGIHVVGEHATELISEASLAKLLDATAWEISKSVHPHPSLSEIYFESALAVEKLQIHG